MKRSLGKCFTFPGYVTIDGNLLQGEFFVVFSEFIFCNLLNADYGQKHHTWPRSTLSKLQEAAFIMEGNSTVW